MTKNVLTKEEIRDLLHDRLDVLVDRMYSDDFKLDLDSQASYEFATLTLEGHREYYELNSYQAIHETIIMTGDADSDTKVYNEFETRSKIIYRYQLEGSELVEKDEVHYEGDFNRKVNINPMIWKSTK